MNLDPSNIEFNRAVEFIHHTDQLVYLTGKAGTGKTTFLKYIKETTSKNTVILAPTGVAAINAGGVTIHSFFQIPFGPFVPNDQRLNTYADESKDGETIYTTFKYNEEKLTIIQNLELLIIDEVSMVRADLLDVIDRVLRIFRNQRNLPFGGVQVILIGDTFQLPPIADRNQWAILSQFYDSPFFFSSKVIREFKPVYIELKKIYRQNEQEFIDLLNRVRVSNVTHQDFQRLNAKYNPNFSGNGSDYIILATHNRIVNETNLTKLDMLDSELFTYTAKVTGDFPDKHKPTDHNLKLKVGAQIMFIKNDSGEPKEYFNGKIGKIKELEEDSITVVFDNSTEVELSPDMWENVKYSYDKNEKRVKEEVIGTFTQFPIRLAWAITVHKSQGLTFEKVIADLGSAFAPGQVYVALSRCTSMNGLKLKSQLGQNAIKTHPRVLDFAKNETPDTLITEHLNTGKADSYYKKAREDIKSGQIEAALNHFKQAIIFRNDLDTSDFSRFLITYGSKWFNYRNILESLYPKYYRAKEALTDSTEEIAELEKEISENNDIMINNQEVIDLLDVRIKEKDLKNSRLRAEKMKLEKELSTEQLKIRELELKLNSISDHLDQEKKINLSNKKEIHRLNNLKLHQLIARNRKKNDSHIFKE